MVALCRTDDPERLRGIGRSLARCGVSRREASETFLDEYEADRRIALRSAVLYARTFQFRDSPREFVRELNRVVSVPGAKPWPAVMDAAYLMWRRRPRDMFRLLTPWLTHRDPMRRWAALHGLELPARKEARPALKVLRLFRGERNLRVRRLLGHIFGQSLYPRHPRESLEEMATWLSDGAAAAPSVARFGESQARAWFESGRGSERQRRSLLRAAREYLDDDDADVRAHARGLVRSIED